MIDRLLQEIEVFVELGPTDSFQSCSFQFADPVNILDASRQDGREPFQFGPDIAKPLRDFVAPKTLEDVHQTSVADRSNVSLPTLKKTLRRGFQRARNVSAPISTRFCEGAGIVREAALDFKEVSR